MVSAEEAHKKALLAIAEKHSLVIIKLKKL
jgi:hypothetical protein